MKDTKNKVFLVTGATGTIGRQVVKELLNKEKNVRVLARNSHSSDFPKEVEVITGDLNKSETLKKAFDGVYAVHFISIGDEKYTPLSNGKSIVELTKQSGIERVTVLWNGEGNESSLEAAIRLSSLEWTILQPQEYMANALGWAESIIRNSEIKEPFGDRPTAAIHENDVGSVIASILINGGHHKKIYTLTGPETLTPRKQVEQLAQTLEKEITFEELNEEQTRARWKEWGLPKETMDYLYSWYGNTPEQGYKVTPIVESILGRPAQNFKKWILDNIQNFKSDVV
ncbi:NAD(P)H-binding protein [Rapidithrix thailandica]|uniref:NAD(P)H-binding protein n=1 Tax=Rapidithrix thailandica TaxID=413964 RepID=A0AAW9S9B7_9BACT